MVLAAFGNTVLQFDPSNLNCEEIASLQRDLNMGAPGYEDSMLQMQVNHEAKGASTLTLEIENQQSQTFDATIALNTGTNSKVRAAFGNIDSSLSGEVLSIMLTHAQNAGPVSMTSYIIRFVPRGEVKP